MKLTAVLLLALGMGQAWWQQGNNFEKNAITIYLWCDGNTGQIRHDEMPKNFKQGNKACHIKDAQGQSFGQGYEPLIDPIDVPAIQETRQVPKDQCRIFVSPVPTSGIGTFTNCLPEEQVWTCVEKTRILEHDEQNPPKYYCRRPQL